MPYLTLIGIVVSVLTVVLVVDLFIIDLPAIAPPLAGNLSAVQLQAIDVYISQSRLLISLNLGVIGGCALLATERIRGSDPFSQTGAVLLMGSAMASVLSIYFGHLLVSIILEMLANDILVLLYWSVVWCYRAQYAFLTIAVTIFIFLVHHEFLKAR